MSTGTSDPGTLKAKATELYKQGHWASAAAAYEDARKAAAARHDVDVSTLAVLHANKAAALLADGQDSEAGPYALHFLDQLGISHFLCDGFQQTPQTSQVELKSGIA